MKEYTAIDLKKTYEDMTFRVVAHCHLDRDLAGGQPATEQGIRGFVLHHLKLTGKEAEDAVKKIKTQEIDKALPENELEEKLTDGVNVVRRSPNGPWLGDWMVKACIKAAASRTGLFAAKRGSKGDVAEMGRVEAIDTSLIDEPFRIYLRNPEGDGPAETFFDELRGKVNTIQGSRSIINHVEKVKAGATFHFEFRAYAGGKIREEDVVNVFAAASRIGLGSAKAYELGKFTIDRMTFEETEEAGKPTKKIMERTA